MADLSGTVSGLVESVAQIQNFISFISQQLLLKPDIESIQSFNTIWNNKFFESAVRHDYAKQQLDKVENILMNLSYTVDNLSTSGTSTTGTIVSGLQETFETVSQNLKQYPYVIQYSGDYPSTVTYNLGSNRYIYKTITYSGEYATIISLSGSLSGHSLNKNILYSGLYITGVYYN